jgi:hypothetical protein
MIIYFLIFSGIGFLLAKQVKNPKIGFTIVLSISLLWMLKSGAFWGLVSLGELLFGFSIYKFLIEEKMSRK